MRTAVTQLTEASHKVRSRQAIAVLLNGAATVHLVWFYLAYVPSALNLETYEQGLAPVPFQHRALWVLPLRWAHHSPVLNGLADRISALHAWFPHGVHAESLVQAPVDLLAVAAAGLVARSIYRAASRTGVLTSLIYPLTLLMVTATYALNTIHRFRFVYDLSSLGMFAVGTYLIYFRRSQVLFALLFMVATVNRETSLFLLLMEGTVLASAWDGAAMRSGVAGWIRRPVQQLPERQRWLLVAVLLAFWGGWHIFVAHLFAGNASAAGPRFWLNIGILLCPLSWPQLLSTFSYCLPLLLLGRGDSGNTTLRRWRWVLPVWFVAMLHYGLLVETRIFGELIPLVVCEVALLAERRILNKLRAIRWTHADHEDKVPA